MLANYRAVFRVPGTAAFCGAGFVMRSSIAIYPIGLVLLVSLRTGHYGFAGLLSGCYTLGEAIGTPPLGRWADRYGQARVIVPASALHVVAVAGLLALVQLDAPDWAQALITVVAGAAYVSVGSIVRARWSYVLNGRAELSTAYSIESVLDEVIFVVGPLAATVVATAADPRLTLAGAAVLVVAGAWWLVSLRSSAPPAHPGGGEPRASALRAPGMDLLVVASVCLGAMFATAELAMIAFCGQHGHPGASGLALACFAAGSGTSGFVYGARARAASMLTRFRRQAAVFAVVTVVFLAAVNVPTLALCAFVAGCGIAPTMIAGFGLVGELVPASALTEGLAWVMTGLNIGYGAGAAGAGRFADAFGARAGFVLTVGAGVALTVFASALVRRMRAVPASARRGPARLDQRG